MTAASYGTSTEDLAYSNSDTFSLAKPADIVVNSLLVLVTYRLAAFSDTGLMDPTAEGFIQKADIRTSQDTVGVWWKRASDSETGSYSIAMDPSTTAWTNVVCTRIDGVITAGDPWEVFESNFSNVSSNDGPEVGVAWDTTDAYLYYAGTASNGGIYDAPTTFTERTDSGYNVMTASKNEASPGSISGVYYTLGYGGCQTSFLGVLKPETGLPPATNPGSFITFF